MKFRKRLVVVIAVVLLVASLATGTAMVLAQDSDTQLPDAEVQEPSYTGSILVDDSHRAAAF